VLARTGKSWVSRASSVASFPEQAIWRFRVRVTFTLCSALRWSYSGFDGFVLARTGKSWVSKASSVASFPKQTIWRFRVRVTFTLCSALLWSYSGFDGFVLARTGKSWVSKASSVASFPEQAILLSPHEVATSRTHEPKSSGCEEHLRSDIKRLCMAVQS